jgi:hypothetical protein
MRSALNNNEFGPPDKFRSSLSWAATIMSDKKQPKNAAMKSKK